MFNNCHKQTFFLLLHTVPLMEMRNISLRFQHQRLNNKATFWKFTLPPQRELEPRFLSSTVTRLCSLLCRRSIAGTGNCPLPAALSPPDHNPKGTTGRPQRYDNRSPTSIYCRGQESVELYHHSLIHL
jgi:hypothetical protein